jgi:RimJ/RimL family protein N-acetyltransferase
MEEKIPGGITMINELFNGKLVKLVPIDLEKYTDLLAKWDCDFEYKRLLDDIPATMYSIEMAKEWQQNHLEDGAQFMIQTTTDEKIIGSVELYIYDWASRNGWVGIGIGEAEYRGKGYGTEAMKLLLKYAFQGLNLHRVTLNVFAFNPRGIRSYEKAGFRYEGTQREAIYKDDQRWDMIEMGILRDDWEMMQRLDQADITNE